MKAMSSNIERQIATQMRILGVPPVGLEIVPESGNHKPRMYKHNKADKVHYYLKNETDCITCTGNNNKSLQCKQCIYNTTKHQTR